MVDACLIKKSSSKSSLNLDLLLSAPLAKVELLDDLCELNENNASGIIDEESNLNSEMSDDYDNSDHSDDDDQEQNDEFQNEKFDVENDNDDNVVETNLINNKNSCKSLEKLVQTFDINVTNCLNDYENFDVTKIAPVQMRTEADVMNDSQ